MRAVVRLQIQDHTPPSMDDFVRFLADARVFVNRDEKNIIAVHCKAGKGRTGSLCCAWLIYHHKWKPEKALEFFATERTNSEMHGKPCGVETASQVRYVHQIYHHLNRNNCWFSSGYPPPSCRKPPITLHRLVFEDKLFLQPEMLNPVRVLVQCGGSKIDELILETDCCDVGTASIDLEGKVVAGDVRISLFEESGDANFSALQNMRSVPNAMKAKGLQLMFLFHTDFLELEMHNHDPPRENLHDPPLRPDLPEHEHTSFSSDLHIDMPPGAKIYRVFVENLDKAQKKIKKGKHAVDSSVALVYTPGGFMDSMSGTFQDNGTTRGSVDTAMDSKLLGMVQQIGMLDQKTAANSLDIDSMRDELDTMQQMASELQSLKEKVALLESQQG